MILTKMLYNLTGSKKSNMVAFKPEVPISKILDKIGTKIQRLNIYIYIYIYVYVYEVQHPMGLYRECIATFYPNV